MWSKGFLVHIMAYNAPEYKIVVLGGGGVGVMCKIHNIEIFDILNTNKICTHRNQH